MVRWLPVPVGFGLTALLLVIAACVQGVERVGSPTPRPLSPTPAITPAFTPVPLFTVTPVPTTAPPPTLVPTPKPAATPISTPRQAPTPTPTPTPSPTQPPVTQLMLDVRAPRDGSTVRTDAVVVHGVTSPEAFVIIQGLPATVGPDGRFQAELTLSPGINTIRVVATDSSGNVEIQELNVTSLALPPLPFLLLITEPEDQSIVSEAGVRLSGRTGPEAITSVNGVSVTVDELGLFSTVVTLEPGPNIIDVVATNNDGRILSTVIAVIYRP